ncbi:MAG: hypothetical protein HYZ36_04020 [Pedosphaera parvula]|nr:hypothetical protein [Pedosphaera parvula]
MGYLISMTQIERSVLQTLRELEAAVRSIATANPKPDLRPLFSRLDALAGQLPKDTDPDLLHYLHRKSYEKARLWLEGRDAENARGACHHAN